MVSQLGRYIIMLSCPYLNIIDSDIPHRDAQGQMKSSIYPSAR
jgi:hypothetical protein